MIEELPNSKIVSFLLMHPYTKHVKHEQVCFFNELGFFFVLLKSQNLKFKFGIHTETQTQMCKYWIYPYLNDKYKYFRVK